jgi:hypothetical protein
MVWALVRMKLLALNVVRTVLPGGGGRKCGAGRLLDGLISATRHNDPTDIRVVVPAGRIARAAEPSGTSFRLIPRRSRFGCSTV